VTRSDVRAAFGTMASAPSRVRMVLARMPISRILPSRLQHRNDRADVSHAIDEADGRERVDRRHHRRRGESTHDQHRVEEYEDRHGADDDTRWLGIDPAGRDQRDDERG